MTIQPGHFLHKAAEGGVGHTIKLLRDNLFMQQASILQFMLDRALKAPCYVLPDGGNLLGTVMPWKVYGEMSVENYKLCRLPHPAIVVEYETSVADGSAPLHCNKRATLAFELPGGPDDGPPRAGMNRALFTCMDFWHEATTGIWQPDFHTVTVGEGVAGRPGVPMTFQSLPGLESEMFGGKRMAKDAEERFLCSGANAVMSLVAALACRNVRVEEIDHEKLNKARVRRGKLPFAKHYALKLTPDIVVRSGVGGHHASPSLHLRRGHIRRLASGQRTWVNAHLVGAPKGAGSPAARGYDATPLMGEKQHAG